jgi:hypothetical protein
MSEVDASIPLSGNTQGFDVQKMLTVADTAQQMRQRQTQTQNQNALSQLLANQQSYDTEGNLTPAAKRATNAFSPQFALQYQQQQIEAHFRKVEEDAKGDERKQRVLEVKGSIAMAAEKARQDKLKAGASAQEAIAAATGVRNSMYKEAGSLVGQEELDKVLSQPYNPEVAAYLQRFAPGEIQEERLAQQDKIAQQNLALKDRQETDRFTAMMRGITDREKGVGNPKVAAFDAFLRDHPNSTPEEQARFIQSTAQAPRSPLAMATAKYLEEHPDATSEDVAKFYSGVRGQAAATVGWDSPTSKGGQQIQALNTATNHLETMRKLGDALKNGNVETFNSVAQAWAQETGNPAPTNWDSAMRIVGGEVVKSVVPGGGGVSERAAAEFKKKLAPGQISGAIDTVEELMRGQATSARTQYTQTTKRDEEEFYRRFDPPAQKVLFGRSSGGKNAKSEIKAVSSKSAYDALPRGAKYSKPGDPPGSYRVKQ